MKLVTETSMIPAAVDSENRNKKRSSLISIQRPAGYDPRHEIGDLLTSPAASTSSLVAYVTWRQRVVTSGSSDTLRARPLVSWIALVRAVLRPPDLCA